MHDRLRVSASGQRDIVALERRRHRALDCGVADRDLTYRFITQVGARDDGFQDMHKNIASFHRRPNAA